MRTVTVQYDESILHVVKEVLGHCPDLLFAYVHGSFLSSAAPRDIDVAIYLNPGRYDDLVAEGELNLGFAIPLEMKLEAIGGHRADIQVLNGAPLSFRYRVISSGVVVVDVDPNARAEFESLSRGEYFDFRPRREEYMREVMA